jgi:hypothetical protein
VKAGTFRHWYEEIPFGPFFWCLAFDDEVGDSGHGLGVPNGRLCHNGLVTWATDLSRPFK